MNEDGAKASAAETVDDEIQRWIGDDEEITDSDVVEIGERAVERLLGEEGRQSLGDERGALTEDEDEDDDDQHARDLVLGPAVRLFRLVGVLPARSRPPRLALPARAAKRRHQVVVEYDEWDEWNQEHDEKIHHRRVDNLRTDTWNIILSWLDLTSFTWTYIQRR